MLCGAAFLLSPRDVQVLVLGPVNVTVSEEESLQMSVSSGSGDEMILGELVTPKSIHVLGNREGDTEGDGCEDRQGLEEARRTSPGALEG